jgi:hypothetical protein
LLFVRVELKGPVPRVQQVVLGPEGLGLDLAPAELTAGRRGHLALGGGQPFVVLVNRLPRTLALVLPKLDDALLFIERESLADSFRLGIWLSAYGIPPAAAAARQAELDDLAARLTRALGS